MRPQLQYDFSEFISIINNMIDGKPTQKDLNDLKKELNRFFKGSLCEQILYTNNVDKLFFGMRVIPVISGQDAVKIIQTDEPYVIERYDLEIDSRLFDPTLGLTDREVLSIILHEVGHIVKDSEPVEVVRKNIDVYLSKNNEHIVISDSIHYMELLAFGIRDSIQKYTSVFSNAEEEIKADEFASVYGFGYDLQSALKKISQKGFIINREVSNKFVVLAWVLRLYKDVKNRRIAALRTIRKSKNMLPSKLDIRELAGIEMRLNRIDDDAIIESALDDMKRKYIDTLQRIKTKGLRSIEDDYYEYAMRIRNIEDEDEALILLRAINSRISIIDDYCSSEDLSASNRERWESTLEKFAKLRDDLSKKAVYRDNFYGAIVVNYPEIKENGR